MDEGYKTSDPTRDIRLYIQLGSLSRGVSGKYIQGKTAENSKVTELQKMHPWGRNESFTEIIHFRLSSRTGIITVHFEEIDF